MSAPTEVRPDDAEVHVGLAEWRRFVDDGRPAGPRRERFVLAYYELTRRVAGTYHRSMPDHIDYEDVRSWATLGLMRAVDHFDPAHVKLSRDKDGRLKDPFRSYAVQSMRSLILDELRKLDVAPRRLRKQQRDLEKAKAELRQQLRREPTEAEQAERLEITATELRRLVAEIRVSWHDSLDESPRELAADEPPTGDAALLCALFADQVARMPVEVATVLALSLYEEMRPADIARELEIPRARVAALLAQGTAASLRSLAEAAARRT